MLSPKHELRINIWSNQSSMDDQLLTQIHTLVPDARIARGMSQNQLCVNLNASDPSTVSALDTLLQNEFAELVFSYYWYSRSLPAKA